MKILVSKVNIFSWPGGGKILAVKAVKAKPQR